MANRIRKVSGDVSILAVDPSLNGSAFHQVINGELIQSWYTTPRKSDKPRTLIVNGRSVLIVPIIMELKDYDRLMFMHQQYQKILDICKPDYAVMEDYSLGSRGMVYDIGELGGVLRLSTLLKGIPLRLIEPTKSKKFGTGDGGATKSQMVVSVLQNWEKIDFSIFGKCGEDLADAYILAQMLLTELQLHENEKLIDTLPKYQKETFLTTSKSYPIPLIRRAFIRWRQE